MFACLQKFTGRLERAVLHSACFPADSYLVWLGGNVQICPCLLVQSDFSVIYSQQDSYMLHLTNITTTTKKSHQLSIRYIVMEMNITFYIV